VYLYRKRVPEALVLPRMGMRIGALAGGIAFALNAIMSTLLFATEGDQVRKALEEQLQASMAKAPDPRTQEVLQQFIAKLNTPEGMATFFLWVLVAMAIVFVLFCAAGGALGASVRMRRR
jgi:cobalamin synthase